GLPVVMISSPLTKNVLGAQFTFTQPARSLPLNSGLEPSASFAPAAERQTPPPRIISRIVRGCIDGLHWAGSRRGYGVLFFLGGDHSPDFGFGTASGAGSPNTFCSFSIRAVNSLI